MKKTKWFPPHIQPVRVGAYQRAYTNGVIAFCWWDNGWSMGWESVGMSKKNRHLKSQQFDLPWRGLAQEPKQ